MRTPISLFGGHGVVGLSHQIVALAFVGSNPTGLPKCLSVGIVRQNGLKIR